MSFTIRLLFRLALIILISNLIHDTDSKKFIVPPFCLMESSADSLFKLKCNEKQDRLFITLKQYSNDVSNYCNNSSKTTSASSTNPVACHAYPTQRLASECNGKQECEVRLNQTTFLYGFMGSNCNFKADILFISYECIPTDYSSEIMPKYDICSGSADADSVIDRPVHGFIHSPSYPYAYQSGRFCQLTIRVDDSIERIEIFLIDMQLEGISQRNFKPTDYLQINSYEQLFGEKSFQVIYNETATAVIKFKSDRWFNKRGFLLYFKAHKLPETTTSTTTTTTTTTITTATTSTSSATTTTTITTSNTDIIPTLSVLQNETNPVNDSFSLTKSSSFASMSISDKSKETNNSFFDLTNVKFLILMIIFGILVGLVIFLLFSINKIKSYNTGTIDASKIQLTNRNSETVNLDYYLSNLDKSVGMITCNSIGFLNNTSSAGPHQQQPFYKLNYLKSMPDDSAVKLLINNNSSMNYTEPVITNSNSTTEVYEDINIDCFSKKDSLNRINENFKRQNEYHFIPSNLIKEDPVLKTTCANLVNEAQPELLDAISSSSSSSMSSSDSLAFNSINNQMTSTPTAPKSMPPARTDPNQNDSFGDETKYDVETKVYTPNEYKSFLDSEIEYKTAFNTETNASVTLVNENEDFNTAKEDDYNYEYQIPSNLPANQSIHFNV